jgi:hypothetical protein
VNLAGVIDRDDVRVVDGRGGLRLLDEPLPDRLVPRQRRGQHLERDPPVQPLVAGQENHSHSAGANLFLQAVSSNNGTRLETGRKTASRAWGKIAHNVLRRTSALMVTA